MKKRLLNRDEKSHRPETNVSPRPNEDSVAAQILGVEIPDFGLPPHWQLVRLKRQSKHLTESGSPMPITTHGLAARYAATGSNIGLLCTEATGIAAIDNDYAVKFNDMLAELGCSLVRHTNSGGGAGRGCYLVQWEPGLPREIWWKGVKIADIISSGHVVIPPSVHPMTEWPYTWATLPTLPLPVLPDALRAYFTTMPRSRPSPGAPPTPLYHDDELARLQAIALDQPGKGPGGRAYTRKNGWIKFQCPRCRELGKDDDRDNAILFSSGAYACWRNDDPTHHQALRRLFGPSPTLHRDPWAVTQADQRLAELYARQLPGRTGGTDTKVLRFHAQIMGQVGRVQYHLSERELALGTGLQRATVQRSHRRLRTVDHRLVVVTPHLDTQATVWQLLPPQLFPAKATQTQGQEGEADEGKTGLSWKQLPDAPAILGHDAFRHVTGLGGGRGDVYERLVSAGPGGLGLTEFGTAHATAWKRLRRLATVGLARHDPLTHRWYVGAADLDAVASALLSYGQAEAERRRYADQRAVYAARIERTKQRKAVKPDTPIRQTGDPT